MINNWDNWYKKGEKKMRKIPKNKISLDPLAYNIMLLGESGIGKEQPVSEPVLTSEGWKPMGEIKIGDKVYGEDGNLHNVTGVYPQGVKDVYEVTFRDGTKTRCGADHLWTVSTTKQRTYNRQLNEDRKMILPLKDILKDYKQFSKDGTEKHKYAVPINKPIKFDNSVELKIDPYFLGLLLGDGGFTTNVITFTNGEDELIDWVTNHVESVGMTVSVRNFENHKQLTLCDKDNYINRLRYSLSEYNLTDCGSREKFIPTDYLCSSVENRAKLLSGIVNTDGHMSSEGKNIAISTYSRQLCYDVAELARSLGFIVTIHEYDRTSEISSKKYETEIEYNLKIIADDYSLLTLSKKHKAKLTQKTVSYVKTIVDIKKIGRELSQCIMTDNPTHLYITNDYIVTHNTTIIKDALEILKVDLDNDEAIFLETNKEGGHEAINNLPYFNCYSWNDDYDDDEQSVGFATLIDDIVENKQTEFPNLRVVVIDTSDGLFPLAEQEVIRMHNKENPAKRVSSIKASWGGFGAGEDKAIEIVLDKLWSLKKVGVSFICIGHTKSRNITDPVTGEDYFQLTTNLPQKYFNAIKTRVHILGVASIDREIVKEKTGKKNPVTKEEIKKGLIKGETRKITFRDDNFVIDGKSRFSNIVSEIPFDAHEFVKAIKDAIESEYKKSGKSIEEGVKEQAAEAEIKAKRIAESETIKKKVAEIVAFFNENKKDIDKVKPVVAKCKELGYDNPTLIDKAEDADAILAFIEESGE